MNKQKIALVLSTGGARGIAHIGVIEELERAGFEITSIAGSSIGALIGATYAYGKLEACNKFLYYLNKKRLFNLIDISFAKDGFIKGNKIMSIFNKVVPNIDIEDLPIPFSAVATDIQKNKEVVFCSGKIHDAIRASISMPLIFRPFKKSDLSLSDGGIINPLPINRIKRNQNELLVASIAGSISKNLDAAKLNKYKLLIESVTIMIQNQIQLSVEKHNPDLVLKIPGSTYSIFQFNKADEFIRMGKDTTRDALQIYKQERQKT